LRAARRDWRFCRSCERGCAEELRVAAAVGVAVHLLTARRSASAHRPQRTDHAARAHRKFRSALCAAPTSWP
jgi:hypothetical protein